MFFWNILQLVICNFIISKKIRLSEVNDRYVENLRNVIITLSSEMFSFHDEVLAMNFSLII